MREERFLHAHEDLSAFCQQGVEPLRLFNAIHDQREVGAPHGLEAVSRYVRAKEDRLADCDPCLYDRVLPFWRNLTRRRKLAIRGDRRDRGAEVRHVEFDRLATVATEGEIRVKLHG